MDTKKLLEEGSKKQTISPEFLEKVKEALKGCNYNDKYVAFWGSVFSNFFPTSFYLDGKLWSSSEKYFMYQKAITFNDIEIAEEMYKLDNPKKIRELGRKVKNFNNEVWDKVKEDIMYKAVNAKFIQDQLCFYCMLKFLEQKFVEGSPVDKIWGVGLIWYDERIFNENEWQGENLLGKILTRVRDELIEDAFQAMNEYQTKF